MDKGSVWKHYMGAIVWVIGEATMMNTNEKLVLYQYKNDCKLKATRVKTWNEHGRFTKVSDESEIHDVCIMSINDQNNRSYTTRVPDIGIETPEGFVVNGAAELWSNFIPLVLYQDKTGTQYACSLGEWDTLMRSKK